MEQAKNAKKEEHTRFVESLLVEMDGNKKKMIRDTLKTQVKVAGMPQQRHPRSARTDRSGNGISPTESKPLSVTSVFNHYCRGYLPPGQTFAYIEKKSQVMDLKHFNDFLRDFGLHPGCFESREEVNILFRKLNLMSKKHESRVELSRAQFEVFIQGVLSFKAPSHQRGMSSEDALNTWRRHKLSGDQSHWMNLQTLTEEPLEPMDTITEADDAGKVADDVLDVAEDDPPSDVVESLGDLQAIDDVEQQTWTTKSDKVVELSQKVSILAMQLDQRNDLLREMHLLHMLYVPDARAPDPALARHPAEDIVSGSCEAAALEQALDRERAELQSCMDWARQGLRQADVDKNVLKQDVSELKGRIVNDDHDKKELCHDLEEVQSARWQATDSIDDLLQQLQDARLTTSRLQSDLESVNATSARDIAEGRHCIDTLRNTIADLNARLHEKTSDADRLTVELQRAQEVAANTAGELDRALADYTKVRHDLDSAERQVAALQFNLDNEVREHQNVADDRARMLIEHEAALESARQEHDLLQERAIAKVQQDLHRECERFLQKQSESDDEIARLHHQVDDTRAALEASQAKVAALESERGTAFERLRAATAESAIKATALDAAMAENVDLVAKLRQAIDANAQLIASNRNDNQRQCDLMAALRTEIDQKQQLAAQLGDLRSDHERLAALTDQLQGDLLKKSQEINRLVQAGKETQQTMSAKLQEATIRFEEDLQTERARLEQVEASHATTATGLHAEITNLKREESALRFGVADRDATIRDLTWSLTTSTNALADSEGRRAQLEAMVASRDAQIGELRSTLAAESLARQRQRDQCADVRRQLQQAHSTIAGALDGINLAIVE
ncbi:Uncharacterized protein PBTT_01195 [Plasmodiophora brassicae]